MSPRLAGAEPEEGIDSKPTKRRKPTPSAAAGPSEAGETIQTEVQTVQRRYGLRSDKGGMKRKRETEAACGRVRVAKR